MDCEDEMRVAIASICGALGLLSAIGMRILSIWKGGTKSSGGCSSWRASSCKKRSTW